MVDGPASTPDETAIRHLLARQDARGGWEAEMVWCTMILSQYVIVQRVVGRPLDRDATRLIARHYEVTRTPEGAWGLHPESAPYVFTTTLAYVALRLLGLSAEDPLTAPARRWLHAQPQGILGVPTWGKFWLALIGLYRWDGINPSPPELFALPRWLPLHPHRYYCHTRYIYTAMAYLYGRRFVADLGPLVDALRVELYARPYVDVDFAAHRHTVAPTDLHVRPPRALRLAQDALHRYERRPAAGLRRRALDRCLAKVVDEQRTSRYQALSPVNGLLNCLALFAASPDHPDLQPSLDGLESWKWEDAAEGRRYAGARSCTWDTAFAIEALLARGEADGRIGVALARAYRFLGESQLTAEIPDPRRADRDPALGGWCFSDGRHRWPVSDCTAEALAAILALHGRADVAVPPSDRVSDERLEQAVAFILSRQNPDGGFATYERRRGSRLLEAFNPSEMFGQCMTEPSYVECTGSALTALAGSRAVARGPLRARVDRAIARGVRYVRRAQQPDGSWRGSWGINRTYAIFHAVRGLRAAGVPPTDPVLGRAGAWLARVQKRDGGWGEHFSGCTTGRYVEHPQSQVVMTSWALLALMDVGGADDEPVEHGIAWLVAHQRPDGSWPSGAVNGVFFGTAMLDYRLYATYFPTWALARYFGPRAGRRRTTPAAAALLDA
jgi:lanosterol synthase